MSANGSRKEKIAFIASGGGMSCAYSAGVAWAFEERGIKPSVLMGSSGSAGTVSYFASGEAKRAADLWREEVTDPKVIQNPPLRLDVDFIIDSMRDRFPLHEERLRSADVELLLAVTDTETLCPVFLSNHENNDWYEVMRASMAIPFVYDKSVSIDNRLYVDGDLSASLHDMMQTALQKGITKIYLCDTRMPSFQDLLVISPQISIKSLKYFIVAAWKKCLRWRPARRDIEIVKIKPSQVLKAGVINNSKTAIEEALHLGYADALRILDAQKA